MTRLLLDMGLPRRAAADLRGSLGHDVEHVGEIGMAMASDRNILEVARNAERVVVTLDRDFTTLLAVEGMDSPSVIYVRIGGLDRWGTVRLLEDLLPRLPAEGTPCFVATVSPTGVRVRTLPI